MALQKQIYFAQGKTISQTQHLISQNTHATTLLNKNNISEDTSSSISSNLTFRSCYILALSKFVALRSYVLINNQANRANKFQRINSKPTKHNRFRYKQYNSNPIFTIQQYR